MPSADGGPPRYSRSSFFQFMQELVALILQLLLDCSQFPTPAPTGQGKDDEQAEHEDCGQEDNTGILGKQGWKHGAVTPRGGKHSG